MATAWPTPTDVQNVLRLETGDAGDDTLVAQDLAAAVAWVSNRCSTSWVDPTGPAWDPTNPSVPGFLADPLFTAAQYEAARLYRRRDSVDGTIGWGDMGVVRVGPKDPDIETLITPYLAIVLG